MANTLATIGGLALATLVGFALGVRYTSHRYQRALSEVADVTAWLRRFDKHIG